ncbi:type II secretion system inner membrane protein GspF [Pseudomonas sp. KU43P]|uniref:type II secretion system inner membrane protein GspF n=1 Tax=Pseudomonas sp. KU43P TaxID=2487887 RepID=UPI0012A96394|nr:type II secretion system inner membrane protein GspF [Pseudomonas sp. KU43P]BBH43840.1 type II secretion system protein F [Pseudomonas sp. KU43P]
MVVFSYRAVDAAGRSRRGCVEAISAQQARQQLRERGWQVLAVRPARHPWRVTLRPAGSLSASQRSLLTRQLATLLHAGMPLAEALQALAAQSEERRVRQVIGGVAAKVAEGNSLAEALAHYPRGFPMVFRATVAAAERTGHLASVFERLAEHGEQQQAMRQKVQLALVYPVILLIVSVAVVGFLLGYVVPDVVQAFARDHANLPTPTQVLIVLSDATRRFGLALVVGLLLLVLLAHRALGQPDCRRRWHSVVLQLPLFGAFIRASEAARFASTLAILSRSGVALVDAMQISAAVVGNLATRERLEVAARLLSEGRSLAGCLTQSAVLPPLMLQMIASGERSGELDSMLERAAEMQASQLSARISLLVSLCEPLMLLVMGGIVLFIVLAILLPILNLNQLVN